MITTRYTSGRHAGMRHIHQYEAGEEVWQLYYPFGDPDSPLIIYHSTTHAHLLSSDDAHLLSERAACPKNWVLV